MSPEHPENDTVRHIKINKENHRIVTSLACGAAN